MDAEFSELRAIYEGGLTEKGLIEFYEYSRGTYALARLMAATETFRRTGRVPRRISGNSNVEILTAIPGYGSWELITKVLKTSGAKVEVGFESLFSWVVGKSLDNIDLINSNSSAINKGIDDIDVELALDGPRRRRQDPDSKARAKEELLAAQQLSDEAIAQEMERNRQLREQRLSLESEIAIARRFARVGSEAEARTKLKHLEERLDALDRFIREHDLRVFSEEADLLNGLDKYVGAESLDDRAATRRAVRGDYALDDLEARFNRRQLGESISFARFGVSPGEEDKLAARGRALTKEVVLPLRKSAGQMSINLGPDKRPIARIDEVRGRFISASQLSQSVYTIRVFVEEYNRVYHSGRCRMDDGEVVPFSVKRQYIERLKQTVIDSLKHSHCIMLCRVFLDDGGAIRSLLVEGIDLQPGTLDE